MLDRSEPLKLAKILRTLGKSLKARDEFMKKSKTTEEGYLESKLPTPSPRYVCNPVPANKMALKPVFLKLLITFAIAIVLLIVALSSFSMESRVDEIFWDPGDEYEKWGNDYYMTQNVEQAEENWEIVKKAWKKRGVTINWKDIEKHGTVDLEDSVSQALNDKVPDYRVGNYSISFFVILLIPTGIFGKKAYDAYRKYQKDAKKFEKDTVDREKAIKYNNEVLPGLIAERDAKLPPLKEEYVQWRKDVLAKLQEAQNAISLYEPYLPEHYHKNAEEIAKILENGRADDIKEAINIFEEDERERARREEERRRIEAEERYRRLMEQKAEEADMEAQAKERTAAENARKELHKRQMAAIDRCVHCIHYSSCGYNLRDSFSKSGDICPSYRPK